MRDGKSMEVLKMMSNEKFICGNSDFPVCNHVRGITENNVGYVTGIMNDGTPFEAGLSREMGSDGMFEEVSVYIPIKNEITKKFRKRTEKTKRNSDTSDIAYFENEAIVPDLCILCLGMVDEGQESDNEVVSQYVYYLEENGILKFTSNFYNGAVFYFTDIRGMALANIKVSLVADGVKYCETGLRFKPFFAKEERVKKFTVIK